MTEPPEGNAATLDDLLASLSRAASPAEAGAIASRLVGRLVPEPPMRRLAPSELGPEAAAILRAIAASDSAARSGQLALALAGAGLPETRDALARFSGLEEPRADERLIDLEGRAVPLWKVVDAVAHDGVPVEAALAALRDVPRAELVGGFRVLLHEDAHGLLHRVTPLDEDPDWRQDQADLRAAVTALAALVPPALEPELLAKTVRDDERDPWATVRAALLALRRGAAAPDVTIARASSDALRPLLRPLVASLPRERAERIVLCAVPEPMSAHAFLDEEQLVWLRFAPTPAIAARALAYAKLWKASPRGKPWQALAEVLAAMGAAARGVIEEQRDLLPDPLLRLL